MIELTTLPLKFSQKLQIERAKRRLSQEKLAELANLHRTTISAIEREKLSPSLDTIARIANAFNLSLCDMFDFDYWFLDRINYFKIHTLKLRWLTRKDACFY